MLNHASSIWPSPTDALNEKRPLFPPTNIWKIPKPFCVRLYMHYIAINLDYMHTLATLLRTEPIGSAFAVAVLKC